MSLSAGQQAILRALGEGRLLRHHSPSDIWEWAADETRINKRLTRPLANQGLIEREVGGWHVLTDKGHAALRALEQEAGG